MTIDYSRMMALPVRINRQDYTVRDTILYALGVGAGQSAATDTDEWRRHELSSVYEDDIRTLPTMAVVLATPGFWLKDPEHAADWRKIVHGEQSLVLHRRIAPEGSVRSELSIEEIYDKGEGRGAILHMRRELYDDVTGQHIATMRQVNFLRGDGGCGGSVAPAPSPPEVPSRPPDGTVTLATRPEQALIYRLSGDYNPLHADPEVGEAAGFRGPILHGLATFGLAGRALARASLAEDPGDLVEIACRFSSPVYPGETIATDYWKLGETFAFRSRVLVRAAVVLDRGTARFQERTEASG